MKIKKVSSLIFALTSSAAFAGTMSNVMPPPQHYLLLEAGLTYSHAFYKSSATFPESRNTLFPSGYSIDPSDFYPNNFWGGYIGASIYSTTNWLFNTRLDMYGEKTKRNSQAQTTVELAPVHLSFTVDKVFGDFNACSYGLGAGAIIENVNDGNFLVPVSETFASSESLHGRTRIDPMIEVFAMYRFGNNFGAKFNVGYQIPVNNKFGGGDLNFNLGINYSAPV